MHFLSTTNNGQGDNNANGKGNGGDGDSFGNMARLYRMNTILRIWCWANYIQIWVHSKKFAKKMHKLDREILFGQQQKQHTQPQQQEEDGQLASGRGR